jgi:PEP-CTERM motif
MPRPLLFGPDGKLYVGDYGAGAVKRYDAITGKAIDTLDPTNEAKLIGPTFLVFAPVPEPETMILLVVGLAGLLIARRARRQSNGMQSAVRA